MKTWMKAFAIGVPAVMVSTTVIAPVSVFFCVDERTLIVPTRHIEVDLTTGAGNLVVPIQEKAQNNEALVSVINKSHENLVTLFLDGGDPYSAQNSLVYPIVDGKISINFSFSKFVGENIDAVFDLEVNYLHKNGSIATKIAKNMVLSTNYVKPAGNIEEIHIYDLNDFHGAAEGFGDDDEDHIFSNISYKNPGVLRIADQLYPKLQQYPGSIFLTAGDNNSGDTFSTSTHGETLYPVLKAMGARYSAVGNHAFEWGLDDTASERFDKWARTDQTHGKYFVCSNIVNHPWFQEKQWHFNPNWESPESVDAYLADYTTWKNQRVAWADPYKLINMNGHLVCLLGLTTKSAMEDGNQAVVKSFSFADYAASLYYASNLCYETLGDEWYNSIETFVILTHVESSTRQEREELEQKSPAYDLAKDIVLYNPSHVFGPSDDDPTKKVSAIISAHSHKSVKDVNINDQTQQPISIGQAATAGRQYLDTTLRFDNSKPIGKRWIVPNGGIENAIQDYYDFKIDCGGWNPSVPEEKEKALEYATKEIKKLHHNPPNDYVKGVVDAYYTQVDKCKEKLNEVIAHANCGEKYLPHQFSQLGHAYWPDPETAKTLPYGEYIQPIGAWAAMSNIAGFDAHFYNEIKSPESSVTWPSISFFNMDSLTTEFQPNSDIKLANIFDLQGYENSLYFGFLSIWQLANIIDYMLSGFNQFEYGSQANHHYVTEPEGVGDDHCLQSNTPSGQICADDTIEECLYLCGPYQWYGFRFTYDVITNEKEQLRLDRKVKLHYYKDEANGQMYPDIYIYVPGNNPAEHIKSPQHWMKAEDYNKSYQFIPCVINSFLYEGGNGQSTMFAKYFKYTEDKEGKAYAVHHFSNISREMMIEFCELTTAKPPLASFDLEEDIVAQLMTEYKG